MVEVQIIGYIHVLIQHLASKDSNKNIYAKLSLGDVAKVDTSVKKSGSAWNEAFMIEVPKQPSRFAILCMEGEQKVGECRYDVNPFYQHPGLTHSIESDLYDQENISCGNAKLKITFYSSENGKLKIRIFHLSLIPQFIEKFKSAKLKVRLGLHAQSTAMKDLSKQFDETVQLLLLSPTVNLTFDVMNEEGILATYTIYNLQKSNVLQKETKAYQVSLFNNDKGVGSIKYQITWIQPVK